MKSLGLYIHIPFCKSKCLYCDFCSFPRCDAKTVADYIDALCADLRKKSSLCREHTVDTVYFGGGTPTVLPIDLLLRVWETVAQNYRVAADAEITAECNPATGGASYFRQMRRAGFTRLSIGLQSTHPKELKALGRLHDFDGFVRTYTEVREAGFDNISADLMSGIPHQTVDSYLSSVERLAARSPEHISAYGLTVEDGTPFGKMGDRLSLPDEEQTREMYLRGIEALAAHGYEQYEISNFAKAGYRSRHNLKYWNCDEYLGFGPAAHSDFGGERFGNSRAFEAYVAGENIEAERSHPTFKERMNEYIMLRLRLSDGVDLAAFSDRFGEDFDARFGRSMENYAALGLAKRTEASWRLSPDGFCVSNAILSELLDFSD